MHAVNLDEQLCRQCRGRCCQGHPGVWSDPQRFFSIFTTAKIPSAEQLSRVVDRLRLTLRDLGGVLIPASDSLESGCCFHREDGCSLSIKERPCQCLALLPDIETLLDDRIHCQLPAGFGSATARENWRPFQPLLNRIQR